MPLGWPEASSVRPGLCDVFGPPFRIREGERGPLRKSGYPLCVECLLRASPSPSSGVSRSRMQPSPKKRPRKARARIELGKFNFACGFDHCRFYLRRLSTPIYNVLFVTGMFDLFNGVRPVRQARVFLGHHLPERRFQHYSPSQPPLNPASLNCPYLFVLRV